jgi:hypothetical protein
MSSGFYKRRRDGKSSTNNSLKMRRMYYMDALMHDQVAIPSVVGLYALMNKMKVVSTSRVAEGAYKIIRMIVDTYFLPNKTLPELRAMTASGALDPLGDFSEACREELDALTSGVLQHR